MFTLDEFEAAFAPQIDAGHRTLVYVIKEFEYSNDTFTAPTMTTTIHYINSSEKSLQELYNELAAEGKWAQTGPLGYKIDKIVLVTNKIDSIYD